MFFWQLWLELEAATARQVKGGPIQQNKTTG
jgi:hypothetical protein